MNKIRSDLNVGCSLLIGAGLALYLAVNPISSAIHWLTGESTRLKLAPVALAAIGVTAVIILGSLVLGALAHALFNGAGRPLPSILYLWWTGFKSGVVSLLLFLPFFLIHVLWRAFVSSITPRSLGAWLYLALVTLLCASAPFWALMLVRRLPPLVFKETLFERIKSNHF